MVRAWSMTLCAVVLLVLSALGLAISQLGLFLDEAALPPRSAAAPLPDGAQLIAERKGCGSGGCWRELTVAAPEGMTGDDLEYEMLPDGEVCSFHSLVNPRRVCTGVIDTDTTSARFYVQYYRWLG